jgi:hypothetical protein
MKNKTLLIFVIISFISGQSYIPNSWAISIDAIEGKHVVLSDGSVWELDTYIKPIWFSTGSVKVIKTNDYSNPYVLINTSNDEAYYAKNIGQLNNSQISKIQSYKNTNSSKTNSDLAVATGAIVIGALATYGIIKTLNKMTEEQDQLDYEYEQFSEEKKETIRKERTQIAFIIIGMILLVGLSQ